MKVCKIVKFERKFENVIVWSVKCDITWLGFYSCEILVKNEHNQDFKNVKTVRKKVLLRA